MKKFFKKYRKLKNLEILIISAKYGLLKMDDMIEYYEKKDPDKKDFASINNGKIKRVSQRQKF